MEALDIHSGWASIYEQVTVALWTFFEEHLPSPLPGSPCSTLLCARIMPSERKCEYRPRGWTRGEFTFQTAIPRISTVAPLERSD